MKLEPRLPDLALRTAKTDAPPAPPVKRGRLGEVLARLAQTGYRVDEEKWERFKRAKLVTTPLPTERGERDAIRRLRRILDVERRLAPSGDLDALCFHLAAAGIEGIPAARVARHVLASISDLFILGDQLRPVVRANFAFIGPDGEFRLGRAMAKHVLRTYRVRDRAEKGVLETLLGAAFVGYVRSTYANVRPGQILHASSRLVTLDAIPDRAPASRAGEPLPPLADRSGLVAWLTRVTGEDPDLVLRSTQSVAALVRLHVQKYPELQSPWRDVATAGGPSAATALHALALVPPVLTAAYLQAGHAPTDAQLDRMLEQLLHFWGTATYEPVRFELSNGSFPWVQRAKA